ncbi:MAG: glutaminyl-peptide cyclotransferase, partial [Actinobacteria bacterium]|nr:glutaminyl-peptide cyclotransferase [Actinomycetota bacterium]
DGADGRVSDGAATTGVAEGDGAGGVARYDVEVVERIERPADGFTQGFVFDAEGRLWESTGLVGESSLRRVDPHTGATVERRGIDADEFAEGLAVGPHGLVQLTWTDGVAYRWSVDPLEQTGEFRYAGEGWGLTFDGESFIQSDGSATLTRRDTSTFEVVSTVEVRLAGEPVDQLNELEWVNGSVYANVWHSDDIVRIDPSTGTVTAVIDASGLWESPARTAEMTLNGIAHRPGDPSTRLWLTGKQWPAIFVVDLQEIEP